MAKYTENFNLIKPEDDEYYDVADFNENMDIIDAELGAVAESANSVEIADKIGQPEDSILSTVFGKLNGFISPDGKGVRIIKSLQHIIINLPPSEFSKTVTIDPVDSSRCVVIMEVLSHNPITTSYTLSDTKLSASYTISQNTGCCMGFWVIEFY